MNNKTIWIIIGVLVAFFCCCGMISAVGLIGFYQTGKVSLDDITQKLEQPANSAPSTEVTMSIPDDGSTIDSGALETRSTLDNTLVPNNDLRELAMRLKEIKNIPETTNEPVILYKTGDEKEFNAINTDTNEN